MPIEPFIFGAVLLFLAWSTWTARARGYSLAPWVGFWSILGGAAVIAVLIQIFLR